MAKHRETIFKDLIQKVDINKNKPTLIAVDGVDGAGKSTFAKEFFKYLQGKKTHVLYSSVDYFHNSRIVRHSTEMKTSQAYFSNSFNYAALKKELLDPLKNSTRDYCVTQYFDHRNDSRVKENKVKILPDTVLVFEGIFSNRDELKDYWDFSIFLDVTFDESYKRMAVRDGCPADPHDLKNERYYQGQKIYFDSCDPKKRASVVINNNKFDQPFFKVYKRTFHKGRYK